jgi:putative NADH-flavin reductase
MQKKIALFGASGQTGQAFLSLALQKGYFVKALVRTPAKITDAHPNLQIIPGDVLSPEDVSQAVQGCDLVVSLFGHVKGSPEWLQTNGTKNIVDAMHAHGVGRILSLSGGGLPYPDKDKPKLADKIIRTIMKIAVPKILNDAIAHHKVLEESGLDWTIVRGPRLTNDAPKGTWRVGWVGVNGSTKIARKDLAAFILTLVEDTQYDGQMPFASW